MRNANFSTEQKHLEVFFLKNAEGHVSCALLTGLALQQSLYCHSDSQNSGPQAPTLLPQGAPNSSPSSALAYKVLSILFISFHCIAVLSMYFSASQHMTSSVLGKCTNFCQTFSVLSYNTCYWFSLEHFLLRLSLLFLSHLQPAIGIKICSLKAWSLISIYRLIFTVNSTLPKCINISRQRIAEGKDYIDEALVLLKSRCCFFNFNSSSRSGEVTKHM